MKAGLGPWRTRPFDDDDRFLRCSLYVHVRFFHIVSLIDQDEKDYGHEGVRDLYCPPV